MTIVIKYFMEHSLEYYTFIGIIGLVIGSFLNVVIYRFPLILKQTVKEECYDFLKLPLPKFFKHKEEISLLFPSSRCVHCKHKIAAWQNIPVLSFLLLKGKCHYCKQSISLRYPAVESLTAIISIITAMHLGVTVATIVALILTWALIAEAFIDYDHTIIPDEISLPFIWLGLLISYLGFGFVNLENSFLGAFWGYLSLYTIHEIFKIITKKDGMGFGDFKLFAMLGAWLGWQMLPQILFLAAVLGSIFGIIGILKKKYKKDSPIPFGPYLAFAGWVAIIWGNKINYLYLKFMTSA